MHHLNSRGLSIPDGNILVEELSCAWPARSPDLNWMDEFVWGWMVNEIRFEEATNKAELKRAIERVWS
eukprot:COSAG05_NODE_17371_length_326_cov_0.907489_1_plen_67_part_01